MLGLLGLLRSMGQAGTCRPSPAAMGVPGVPGVVTEGSTVDKPGSPIWDQKGHTRYPHRASPCGRGRRVINRGFPIVSGPAHSHSHPATCICLLPHLHLHLSDGDRCARKHGAIDTV